MTKQNKTTSQDRPQSMPVSSVNPDAAVTAAVEAGAAAVTVDETRALAPPGPRVGDKVQIVSVGKPMLHLFTNVWFNDRPVPHVVDDFVKTQLDASKLAVYPA